MNFHGARVKLVANTAAATVTSLKAIVRRRANVCIRAGEWSGEAVELEIYRHRKRDRPGGPTRDRA